MIEVESDQICLFDLAHIVKSMRNAVIQFGFILRNLPPSTFRFLTALWKCPQVWFLRGRCWFYWTLDITISFHGNCANRYGQKIA
jgi:hypothetical protein